MLTAVGFGGDSEGACYTNPTFCMLENVHDRWLGEGKEEINMNREGRVGHH